MSSRLLLFWLCFVLSIVGCHSNQRHKLDTMQPDTPETLDFLRLDWPYGLSFDPPEGYKALTLTVSVEHEPEKRGGKPIAVNVAVGNASSEMVALIYRDVYTIGSRSVNSDQEARSFEQCVRDHISFEFEPTAYPSVSQCVVEFPAPGFRMSRADYHRRELHLGEKIVFKFDQSKRNDIESIQRELPVRSGRYRISARLNRTPGLPVLGAQTKPYLRSHNLAHYCLNGSTHRAGPNSIRVSGVDRKSGIVVLSGGSSHGVRVNDVFRRWSEAEVVVTEVNQNSAIGKIVWAASSNPDIDQVILRQEGTEQK